MNLCICCSCIHIFPNSIYTYLAKLSEHRNPLKSLQRLLTDTTVSASQRRGGLFHVLIFPVNMRKRQARNYHLILNGAARKPYFNKGTHRGAVFVPGNSCWSDNCLRMEMPTGCGLSLAVGSIV